MKKKIFNKTLGIILAITLPLTVFGLIGMTLFYPSTVTSWKSFRDIPTQVGNTWRSENVDEKYDNLLELDIEEGINNVTIKPSENDVTAVTYSGYETITLRVEHGNKLVITGKDYGNRHWIGTEKSGELTILLGKSVKEVDFDSGVGSHLINDLNLTSFSLNVGVGEIKINNVTTTNDFDVDGGVGSAKLTGINAREFSASAGIGEIVIDNLTADRASVESGIGSIKVRNSKITTLDTKEGIGNLEISNSEITNRYNERDDD